MENAKIKALLANEEFVKRFEAVKDAEEIEQLLKEFGSDMSEEELADFVSQPAKFEENSELSEEDVEAVAGGIIGAALTALTLAGKFATSVYGSPQAATKGITSFWCKKLGI